jgi:hypothetical protein
MVTPVAPSTSNINDRLQCRRHLKAEEVMQPVVDIYDSPSVDVIRRTGQDNVNVLRIQRRPPGLGICQFLKLSGIWPAFKGVRRRT